jgi:hypothetical protein
MITVWRFWPWPHRIIKFYSRYASGIRIFRYGELGAVLQSVQWYNNKVRYMGISVDDSVERTNRVLGI